MKHGHAFRELGLPILDVLDELLMTLSASSACVLIAPPGAGKTTVVPLALLGADGLPDSKVLVVVPRRLAARTAAERMAELLGEKVGETVGVRARLASQIGPATRIEVVTEGVFTRMVIDDPELTGIGVVIFDEFHERSLEADFGLALCLDIQAALREDLKLLIMSATLDGGHISSVLHDASIVESEGRMYPIETRYVGVDRRARIERQLADVVVAALHEEPGSCLVFLPGQGEIWRLETMLQQLLRDQSIEVLPLFGGMSLDAQRAAIRPCREGRRKVVLATSIAETSITIDGVRIVIDSGLARVPRFDVGARLTRLETVRVSRASADQRRGRAGRTEPGVCYRLWSEPETQGLRPFEAPEIQSADLTDMMLGCAAWGVSDPATLTWVDVPPAGAVSAARDTLIGLDAIGKDHRMTSRGEQLRSLPLPPHLGQMLLEAAATDQSQHAAELCAVLVERGVGGSSLDLDERVAQFRSGRGQRDRQVRELSRQWARAAPHAVGKDGVPTGEAKLTSGQLLMAAYPDRVAKRRGTDGQFLLANGRAAQLDQNEPLSSADFLVVADMQGSAARARILAAAQLSEAELKASASDRISQAIEVAFDRKSKTVRADKLHRLDAIVLQRETLPVPRDLETACELARGLVEELGFATLPWSKAQKQLMGRVAFLRQAGSDAEAEWPDLSESALKLSHSGWLAPFLIGKAAASEVSANDLAAALDGLLDWQQRQRLNDAAPTHFVAPTGNRHEIDYDGENAPGISLRVQELYGLKHHPTIADGRLPLTLSLLSPAGRPIQVTRDLPGFWDGSWRDVKTEMKGRYPKHVWPDDPAHAEPTTRAKPRTRSHTSKGST
ncbi:MAG: ATP-dependent helicase HrpB [Pseudomonadota bacterium]